MNKLLFLLFIPLSLIAQSNLSNKCAYDLAIEFAQKQNPQFLQNRNLLFESCKKSYLLKKDKSVEDIFTIPVVFHVVYNGEAQNISDEVLQSQIDVLNENYNKQNINLADLREVFVPFAADAKINFELANFDPEGNPTNGITRTQTSNTDFAPNFLDFTNPLANTNKVKSTADGGHDAWNPTRYMNVWICNTGGAVLGYAYPPSQAPNWPGGSAAPSPDLDGIVIHFQVIGRNNPEIGAYDNIADEGRTLVHETGHYLGLRHIWGDAIEFLGQDGCQVDDGIDDTPNMATNSQQQTPISCGNATLINKNTCEDSPVDYPDMFENFMDYSLESCQSLFTHDQVGIMREMVNIARTDLSNILDASVSINNVSDVISVDDIIDFSGFYLNVEVVKWMINDEIVSNDEAFSYEFNNVGIYDITLIGTNALTSDTANITIEVVDPISGLNDIIADEIEIFSTSNFIEIQNQLNQNLQFYLYDVNGRLIENHNLSDNSNQINIQALTSGMYVVAIKQNNQLIKSKTILK